MFDPSPACAEVRVVNRDLAQVEVLAKRKKVAIVGFATNTLSGVPWTDPTFEIWGMNQGYLHMQRKADRWFEMHLPEAQADLRDPDYQTFLRDCGLPLYMIATQPEYPTSLRYPIEDAIKWVGRDYFMSSAAYMAVLAAMEGFEEIHFYGINLAIGEEYFYEKPNCEYLIGLLEGRGFKVVVPHASSLLKQYARYGYSVDARPNQNLRLLLENRMASYRAQAEKAQTDFFTYKGMMDEAQSLMHVAEGLDHGADIVLMPAPPPKGATG